MRGIGQEILRSLESSLSLRPHPFLFDVWEEASMNAQKGIGIAPTFTPDADGEDTGLGGVRVKSEPELTQLVATGRSRG
jgi:hypothetical protein